MTKMTSVMMTMIITSVLTSLGRVLTSQHPLVYCPISSPNGTQLCAVNHPFYGLEYQTFDDVKLSSCALSTMKFHSSVFNYNRTGSHCTVFQSSPELYERVDGCVAYEVISITSSSLCTSVKSRIPLRYLVAGVARWCNG